MFYLLGVNHYIQYISQKISNEVYTDFVMYISKIVEEKNIDLIAEEFNEDCLELNHVKHSILQLTSEEISTRHLFIDPVQSIRNELRLNAGLFESNSNEANHLREIYWLEQVKEYTNCNVLFCIGANHIGTFSKLIEEQERDYVVIDPYWHQDYFQKETFR